MIITLLAICAPTLILGDSTITVNKATWKFNYGFDQEIIGVETVEQCQKICLDDPENCRGYTHMQVGLNGYCYKFKELTGMHACETCSSGTTPQILDGSACTFNKEIKLGEASAKSVDECWKICFETTDCLAFTYHNASSQHQNVCELFSQQCTKASPCEDCMSGHVNRLAAPVQCYEYGILDEETRNVYYGIDYSSNDACYWDALSSYQQSLRWSGDGYYRMVLPAGEMLLEGDPGKKEICGTVFPGYLLEGSHPTNVGQEVDSIVYFSQNHYENYTRDITITRCPDNFYVYYLRELARQSFKRYCSDLLNI